MERVLYVVSTYYHALIACLKQFDKWCCADILCTDYIPEGEQLALRIQVSNLFERVYFIGDVHEYAATSRLDYILHRHSRNPKVVEESFPETFRFDHYNEINIFHDDTWMARYLKDRRMQYRLIEDALDSCKNLSTGPFSYMLQTNRLKLWIKQITHIGYVFYGADGLAKEIEVNEKNGVEFDSDKLIEIPRQPLFDRLTVKEIELLKDIFLQELPENIPEGAVLLLTQPLHTDGYLDTESEQCMLYQKLAEKYLLGKTLVIKPHPRDLTNYTIAFPDAIILNKNMPAELLSMTLACDFSKTKTFLQQPLKRDGSAYYPKLGGYVEINKME